MELLILDVSDLSVLDLKKYDRIILSGRAVKLLDKLDKNKVTLCLECSDGVDFPYKISYAGMAQLIADGKARVLIEADSKTLDKVIKFLNVMKLGGVAMKADSSPIGTEVGSLHCAFKHMCAAVEAVKEVYEKAIRLGLSDFSRFVTDVIALWRKFINILYASLKTGVARNEVERFVDDVRKVRGSVMSWLYGVAVSIPEDVFPAFADDFGRLIGNLYHIELHMTEFAQEVASGLSCIVCEEDANPSE